MSEGEGHIVSENIYQDLGFTDHASLKVKARLAMQISDLIKAKHLTQNQASARIGLSQAKLSGLLRGQFRGISETKMMDCIASLGNDVEIVVRAAAKEVGHVRVVVRQSARGRIPVKSPASTRSAGRRRRASAALADV